jgi:1-acyl-sn-glycerol-3-phosphate acyltransferase
VWIPLALLLAPIWSGAGEWFADRTHRALALYGRTCLYMRIGVEGEERRVAGTRILVANHQSWLDPLVLMGIEPRLAGPVRATCCACRSSAPWSALAASSRATWASCRRSTRWRAASPPRARAAGACSSFRRARARATALLGAFHRGAFRTAFDHGLAIQPVVIEGSTACCRARDRSCRPTACALVSVRYLAAIEPPFDRPGGACVATRAASSRSARAPRECARGGIEGCQAAMPSKRGSRSPPIVVA